jgi:hypothetical protein
MFGFGGDSDEGRNLDHTVAGDGVYKFDQNNTIEEVIGNYIMS